MMLVIVTVQLSLWQQLQVGLIPTHIELGNHVRGLHNDSVILLEQVRTIDRIRLRGYVGSLSGAMMRKVDEAILVSFGVTVQRRT